MGLTRVLSTITVTLCTLWPSPKSSWGHNIVSMIAAMRAFFLLSTCMVSLCISQTNFGGTSEKNSNPYSDVNTRIFTGNQALDSGLVGIGLGALGATVLAPAVGNALNGGNNNGFNNNGFNSGSFNACERGERGRWTVRPGFSFPTAEAAPVAKGRNAKLNRGSFLVGTTMIVAAVATTMVIQTASTTATTSTTEITSTRATSTKATTSTREISTKEVSAVAAVSATTV